MRPSDGRAPRVRRTRSQIFVQVLESSRIAQTGTRAGRAAHLSSTLCAFTRTERRNVTFPAFKETRAVLARSLLLPPSHIRTYICIAHNDALRLAPRGVFDALMSEKEIRFYWSTSDMDFSIASEHTMYLVQITRDAELRHVTDTVHGHHHCG